MSKSIRKFWQVPEKCQGTRPFFVIWYSFQFCVLGCSDPLGVRDLRALRPFVVMWYSDQFSDDRCSDTQCIKEEEICQTVQIQIICRNYVMKAMSNFSSRPLSLGLDLHFSSIMSADFILRIADLIEILLLQSIWIKSLKITDFTISQPRSLDTRIRFSIQLDSGSLF